MASLVIHLDRSRKTTLIKQLYDQIRLHILHGDIHAGHKLPSTRQLAAELGISRIIVVEVYEQLSSEGYLTGRPASGTYVSEGARMNLWEKETRLPMPEIQKGEHNKDLIDFRSGVPALDLFPRKLWARLGARVCRDSSPATFGYDQAEGALELRTALARYLARARRILCHPDQILIASGAVQALSLTAHLLLGGKGKVIIEDPITFEVQRIFSAAGAEFHPLPVDDFGLQTELLPEDSQAKFVFVTPSHQFPLGGVLPIQRRIRLIQFSQQTGCYIVEDDYDSEYCYTGTPVSSLRELDPERVIYIGTFSKTLSPALRLGYIVLPSPLVEEIRQQKHLTDRHSPVLEQLMLARLIEEGHLERHIFTMKKVYRKKREVLMEALKKEFEGSVVISGSATGLHLIAGFPGRVFSDGILAGLEKNGVRVYPVEAHAIVKGLHESKIILGYGNLDFDSIKEGVRRMKKVL